MTGQTRQLPDIYLVAGEIIDPKGPIPPGVLNLVFLFRALMVAMVGPVERAETAVGPETARKAPPACSIARKEAVRAGPEVPPGPEDGAAMLALGEMVPISFL